VFGQRLQNTYIYQLYPVLRTGSYPRTIAIVIAVNRTSCYPDPSANLSNPSNTPIRATLPRRRLALIKRHYRLEHHLRLYPASLRARREE